MASAVVGSLRVILGLDSAEFEAGTKKAEQALKGWSKDFKSIGQQATQLGGQLTAALTLPIVGAFAGATKAAMDFESSFADVRKTVGNASEQEFSDLALAFRKMAKEIPLTTTELNKIAALGGQMGVPIKQLENFTRNVAALGVAVDGISTEEAAIGLAQIGNIAGLGTSKVAEMASSLVHLGNSSNATEADILEFSKRLMGAGSTVGMTVPEVMALSTAMANVGINAEAGGTAMSQVIGKMSTAVSLGGEKLTEFAKVAGVTADDFVAKWKSSPIEAIDLFVKGLAGMRQRGEDINLTMGEVGTTGERMQLMLKSLSGTTVTVADNLDIANEGWRAGNKHLEEAEEKYKITANQIKMLWSAVKDLGITLGNAFLPAIQSAVKILSDLMPVVDSVLKVFTALPGPVQLVGVAALGLVAAAGPALILFGQLAFAASSLTEAFGKKGIATKALAASYDAATASATLFRNVITGLPALIGAVGVAFGGAALQNWTTQIMEAKFGLNSLNTELERITKNGGSFTDKVKAIMDAVQTQGSVSVAAALATRALRGEQEQAAVASDTQATAATRNADAQKALKSATEDLALQIATLEKSGAPAAEVIATLGAQAEGAKKQARLLGIDMAALPPTVLALAEAWQKAQPKSKHFNNSLEDQKKALKEAEKAAKEHEAQIKAQEQALSALGLVTEKEVNEKIVELTALQEAATKAGVPLVSSLKAQETVLKALAAKAKESGVEFSHLTALIAELDSQIRALSPSPQALVVKMGLPAVITGLQEVNFHQNKVWADNYRLGEAYQTLGITSTASLMAQAQAARVAYAEIAASGTASYEQLIAARQRVSDAELAAGLRTMSLWEQFRTNASIVTSEVMGLFTNTTATLWGIGQDFITTFANLMLPGLGSVLEAAWPVVQAGLKKLWDGIQAVFSSIWSGIKAIGSAIGGLFKGEGAKTNDTRDVWMDRLGGLEGAHGIIAQSGNDPALLAAFEKAYAAGNRDDFSAAATEFDARRDELGLAKGGIAVSPTLRMFGEAGPEAVIPLDRLGDMLSGREKITPEGAEVDGSAWGGGSMVVQFVADGRATAEWIVPFMPGAVRRLGLAGTF